MDSIRRRVRAMHSLYYDAAVSMTVNDVNHFEREGVLPIAFSLFHITNMIDTSFLLMTNTPMIWDSKWQDRIGMTIPDHGKSKTVSEMVHQKITDYEAFKEYMGIVFSRTEKWLETLDTNELTRVIVARPFPLQIASTFSARVAGEVGITLDDAIECWIYQHGLRHMGEIEHARGLVGLGGMTS